MSSVSATTLYRRLRHAHLQTPTHVDAAPVRSSAAPLHKKSSEKLLDSALQGERVSVDKIVVSALHI